MFLASPFWLIKMKVPLSTGRRDTHEDVERGEGSGRGSISAARLRTGKELRHLAADGRGLRHVVEIFFLIYVAVKCILPPSPLPSLKTSAKSLFFSSTL